MRSEHDTAPKARPGNGSGWLWRLRRVTLREVRLLIEAQCLLAYCQLLRRRRPVGRLLSLDPTNATGVAGTYDVATVREVSWALTRAARYGVFRPRCLVRSMALQRMLRRHGVEGAEIRIGVRLRDAQFGAHAWIELDGKVVGDDPRHVRTFEPATDLRLVQL